MTQAQNWKSGSHDAAMVVAKNMGETTRAFWGSKGNRRAWFVFGGGFVFWIFIAVFYVMYLELKIGLWLAVEMLLAACLLVYGVTYAISSAVVRHQLKGVQAPPKLPLTVNLPGPRDWTPAE